jgi:2-oxoglutarate dehydrogenase E1 component
VSTLEEMGEDSTFHRVLWDDAELLGLEPIKLVKDDKIRRVVMCSGKVYYDLYEEREKRGIDDIYLLRLEQLYPFPAKALMNELIALQATPRSSGARKSRKNMGAGLHRAYIEWVLNRIEAKHQPAALCRPFGFSASTATGLMSPP